MATNGVLKSALTGRVQLVHLSRKPLRLTRIQSASAVLLLFSVALACFGGHASGQVVPQAVPLTPPSNVSKDYEFTCPGSFASDLTVVNCEYTGRQRLQQFLTTGITDQAMVLSITGSLFTQAIPTPSEWPRTWKYYGYRVGASYTQSVGNATAQLIVGAAMREDPRHVQCDRDPLLYGRDPSGDKPFSCTKKQRFAHALLDSITVRRSFAGSLTPEFRQALGKSQNDQTTRSLYRSQYKRLPALSRLVGAYAGAYAQYPWEPGSANKFGAVSQRAALTFAPTFLGSFFTEYGTSIFSHLKKAKQ
jgi:hypothetical protein